MVVEWFSGKSGDEMQLSHKEPMHMKSPIPKEEYTEIDLLRLVQAM